MSLEDRRIQTQKRAIIVAGICMALIYFIGGLWLLLIGHPNLPVSLKQQKIAGGVLILYSIYRGYMLYARSMKKSRYSDRD